MPPGVVPLTYNIWEGDEGLKKQIDVGCLLPTGIFISLTCSREETITHIKTVCLSLLIRNENIVVL